MKTTIFSKKLDQNLTFSRPGHAYIYVDINGQHGTSGRQIRRKWLKKNMNLWLSFDD